jgi:HAMP domain-containing protein
MKNMSIRTKILAGVLIVNLLGITAVMVYLHESYAGGLDVAAIKAITTTGASWDILQEQASQKIGTFTDPKAAQTYITDLKTITGADYAMLIDRSALNAKAYAKARQAANQPNNFDEGDTYVQIATTNENLSDEMQFAPSANDVPETGKLVGIANGACAQTCHNGVKGTGDYWKVKWNDENSTDAHAVYPISNAKGQAIGVLYSVEDISAAANSAKASMVRTFFVIAITLVISTLLIGMMIDLWVFKRLNLMVASMEDISMRVVGGDFTARFQPDGSNDEIGRFEQFFGNLMDLMTSTLQSLTAKK